MTEQELRQEFKNHSDCYSDAFEVIQAMTEDAAIALAKAYADARESKEIAELRDQLRIETDLKNVYSKACVESGKVIESRDTEIAELKAECDKRGGCIIEMSQERARLDSENKELKAEIKRLRDGVTSFLQWVDSYNDYGVAHKDIRNEINAIFYPNNESLDAPTKAIPSRRPDQINGTYCLRDDHSTTVIADNKKEAAKLLKTGKANVLCLIQPTSRFLSPAPVTEGKETANESSKLLQCPHCERMFDPSDENDFCLNGTCDAK